MRSIHNNTIEWFLLENLWNTNNHRINSRDSCKKISKARVTTRCYCLIMHVNAPFSITVLHESAVWVCEWVSYCLCVFVYLIMSDWVSMRLSVWFCGWLSERVCVYHSICLSEFVWAWVCRCVFILCVSFMALKRRRIVFTGPFFFQPSTFKSNNLVALETRSNCVLKATSFFLIHLYFIFYFYFFIFLFF